MDDQKARKSKTVKRRSGLQIMRTLIVQIRPLLPIMILAIALGVLGFLCAIFITIIAGYGIIHGISSLLGFDPSGAAGVPFFIRLSVPGFTAVLIIIAVLRGVLHYGEQYCNHFIAFRLLAIIRHKVFTALRKLCPAKLEGRDKGDLISLITSDIELLEVFYAHTISPIAIGAITSVMMGIFIGFQHPLAGILAGAGYFTVGLVIPLWNGKRGGSEGMEFREAMGELNGYVLGSLYGLDETIQYGTGDRQKRGIEEKSRELGKMQRKLYKFEASQKSVTNLAIQLFSMGMLVLMIILFKNGMVTFVQMITAIIAMMSSFGPVVALSNLSNNLNQTLACGERILSLLEEVPHIDEVEGRPETEFNGACVENVDFAYEDEVILTGYSIIIPKGKVIGIHGASGSGKSTLLKLLMRFWDVQKGQVSISDRDIREVNTSELRDMESYMTQETWIFHDTIADNIAIGKPGAGREEIESAARKASIHDFIMSLPDGYDTNAGELGDTLSGGERQRIGLARAFLHEAPFMLLDEPTSNLDSLNEGMILKALKESCKDKTIIMVSHRKSTLSLADVICEMGSSRKS
ncbi:MAG: ABC transporter ATP-binding protein [Clostridiales bacterium]|nr:ABC transporter ATP-binding protein [Clostridiales bacterium]MBS5878250.1 ABC transporter ATP-binding protein [Clostridiales bacterium]MDU0939575.1 ABC transporter ATP-binding protein [Clostridiales bacterium]MDU1041425.1 ABC transporter ATP-binding protein [Clostridiales bacterium]MDU3489696.1 ABC transporter ATP-binding protein [Clostridiales bacterium]